MASSLERPPGKSKPFFYRNITLSFALRRPKVHTNRNLASLNRWRYFDSGHVSDDVIIRAMVRSQMGWGKTTFAKDKISFILSFTRRNYPSPGWSSFLFSWQDIKRQNMSRDLFYYLYLKLYVTANHSGQNHIRDNKTNTTYLVGPLS